MLTCFHRWAWWWWTMRLEWSSLWRRLVKFAGLERFSSTQTLLRSSPSLALFILLNPKTSGRRENSSWCELYEYWSDVNFGPQNLRTKGNFYLRSLLKIPLQRQGVGALYVRRRPRVRVEPIQNGGGQVCIRAFLQLLKLSPLLEKSSDKEWCLFIPKRSEGYAVGQCQPPWWWDLVLLVSLPTGRWSMIISMFRD